MVRSRRARASASPEAQARAGPIGLFKERDTREAALDTLLRYLRHAPRAAERLPAGTDRPEVSMVVQAYALYGDPTANLAAGTAGIG